MAAIVAIPLLLILTVLLVMPRGSPYAADFTRSQPFSRSNFEEAATGGGGDKAGGGGGGGAARYAVVIDAGSTGSRVHIFKFLMNRRGQLELQFDKFDQLKPGLSSYADAPPKAAESLAPLLDLAAATIPADQQATTRVMVGATAGLRLLPDGKADLILAEVRAWLGKRPFKVGAGVVDGWVSGGAGASCSGLSDASRHAWPPTACPQFAPEDVKILSGVDEGAFAWLTLNYLLGKLGGGEHDTGGRGGARRGGAG